MSKTNKIVILVAAILIIILGIIAINKNKDNETSGTLVETETTNAIATKKTNGTYEIYNADITTDTGATVLAATVKNVSGNDTERQMIEIALLDKKGNEVGKLKVTIPRLETGKSTQIQAVDLKVYENIHDFKIK